jgi:hypothetical protein
MTSLSSDNFEYTLNLSSNIFELSLFANKKQAEIYLDKGNCKIKKEANYKNKVNHPECKFFPKMNFNSFISDKLKALDPVNIGDCEL